MKVRLVEGLHLTATNRRHIGQIVANGWQSGEAGALAYRLEPLADHPHRYRYAMSKQERDDWGRPQLRVSRGIVEVHP